MKIIITITQSMTLIKFHKSEVKHYDLHYNLVNKILRYLFNKLSK